MCESKGHGERRDLLDEQVLPSATLLTEGKGGSPHPPWSFPDGVDLVRDPTPARWVEQSLATKDWATVGSLVPDNFEAHARILHPAYRRLGLREREPISWAEVAAMTGRTLHPLAQFSRLAGVENDPNGIPSWGDRPADGSLPSEVAGPLLRVLREFTARPEMCWFCVWHGYGDLFALEGYEEEFYKHVKIPHREYLLLRGAMERVSDVGTTGGGDASTWWPDDRAWFVATEIDLDSTYVGGSADCIAALLDHDDLEAFPANLDDRVDWGSDTVNA